MKITQLTEIVLRAVEPRKVTEYGIPFALVAYLGFREGGYEPLVHEEIGIVCWWLVLLAAVAGFLTARRPARPALVALGLLVALGAWSGLAMLWSESAGSTAIEVARITSYAGAFALIVAMQGPGSARRTLIGVTAAIAAIITAALLSRLQPAWFGPNALAETLPDIRSRLAYPLGYWNALAGLVAIGLPLVLWLASSARHAWVRVAAASFTPVMGLVIYLTLSRSGALAAALAVAVFVALYPVRLALLPTLAAGGIGGLILIWAASQRPALTAGLEDGAANSQGDQLTVIVLVVVALAAAAQYVLHRVMKSGRLRPPPRLSRRLTVRLAGSLLALVLAGWLLAGGAGKTADGFRNFKSPDTVSDDSSRLTSASSNGRWQYWSAAVEAGKGAPAGGIGPGTYEFYWERNGALPGFIRNAHSLYVEMFAELGIVGLLLTAGLGLFVLWSGARAALRATGVEAALLAAATAAAAAFVISAGVDWAWEMPVLPVSFLAIAAAILGRGGTRGPSRLAIGFGVLATLALLAIAIPYLSNRAVEGSQRDFRTGELGRAYDEADRARRLQPFAAVPRLQLAYVLEAQGRVRPAIDAAREAVARERTNWTNELVLARLLLQAGEPREAHAAYRRARALNHSSIVLERPLREQIPGEIPTG